MSGSLIASRRLGGVLLGILLMPAAAPAAEIFKRVDEHGNVHYSDSPLEGGEAVDLKPLPTMPMTTIRIPDRGSTATDTGKKRGAGEAEYDSLGISSPANDTSIHSFSEAIPVTASIDPPLKAGHKLRVLVNGKASGNPGPGPVFSVGPLERGTHTIGIEVVDGSGTPIQGGESVQVHVHQPSVLSPNHPKNRPPKPKPNP